MKPSIVVVAPVTGPQTHAPNPPDEEGFVLATGFSKQKCQELRQIQTRNNFQILNEDDDIVASLSPKGDGFDDVGSLDKRLESPVSNG